MPYDSVVNPGHGLDCESFGHISTSAIGRAPLLLGSNTARGTSIRRIVLMHAEPRCVLQSETFPEQTQARQTRPLWLTFKFFYADQMVYEMRPYLCGTRALLNRGGLGEVLNLSDHACEQY